MEWNTVPARPSRSLSTVSVIGGLYTNGTDKATRFQNCMTDNGNGTITATQDRSTGRLTATVPGSFPNGTVTVIFQDHDYTPDKSEITRSSAPPTPCHWDNILIS